MSDKNEAPVFEATVTPNQLKKLADGLHAQLSDTQTPTKVRLEVFAPDERHGRVARYLATLQDRFTSKPDLKRVNRPSGYRSTETLPDIAKYSSK